MLADQVPQLLRRHMRQLTLFFFYLLACSTVHAGKPDAAKVSLSGQVTEKGSGIAIPGAEVYFPDLRTGTTTDVNGEYTLHGLPAAKALISVSMVGYAAITETIDLATVSSRDFVLVPSVTEMHDVVVTGTSKATEMRREPVPMAMVGRGFLRENASSNIIETLNKVPGVSTVSSGPNISKPYIRGLGANRVLTLFDGIRQESQQWGEEHGVEVDQFLIDRVEVVKGPASLIYGSDALAGVVNLLPAPSVPAGRLRGAVLGNYDTNNNGLAGSVNVDGNNGKFLYGGRLSGKEASNYRNRYDGRVYGTKYNEKDFSAYFGLNRAWGYARLNFSLYDNLQEVPDGSRDSTSRRFTYQVDEADTLRPIASNDMLSSYKIGAVHQHVQFYRAYITSNFNLGDNRLSADLGFQRSIRREYSHPEYPDLPGLFLSLNTFTYDLRFHLAERKGWSTTAGLNGMLQLNDAAQGTELLIPDYHSLDIGPFLHVKKELGKLDLSGGVRYDHRKFRSDAMYMRLDPITGFEMSTEADPMDSTVTQEFVPHAQDLSGLSGSIGAAWNLNDRLTLKANLGRGYRAPSAAETTAQGVHAGAGLMQLGDAELKPEFNLQEDLGFFYNGTHITASVEVFNNSISNYIYNEKLASVTGGDSLYSPEGQDLPVFKFRQTAARLYGGEVSLDVHPHPFDRIHFENSLSLVIAENRGGGGAIITDSTKYLPLIPPLHLVSEVRYDLRKQVGLFAHMFFKVGMQVYWSQNRFYSASGTETRTPGYTLLDAGIGSDVVDKEGRTILTFTLLGSNLADVGYQSNMSRLKYFEDYPENGSGRSGIYNMGRNFSLKVVVPFDVRKKSNSAS